LRLPAASSATDCADSTAPSAAVAAAEQQVEEEKIPTATAPIS
jgi:hypothetical protein